MALPLQNDDLSENEIALRLEPLLLLAIIGSIYNGIFSATQEKNFIPQL